MATESFVLRGNKPVISKDPDASLDYTVSWSDWLAGVPGDIIVSAEILLTGGLVLESKSNTASTVTAWISGGNLTDLGQYATATYRITTQAGRIDDRTLYFKVVER